MNMLQQVINERPLFHKGETEIERDFSTAESFLSEKQLQKVAGNSLTCYGVEKAVLTFIADNLHPESKTIETGAGCSTLVFACCGARHTAVTPAASEIQLIRAYAAAHDIPMGKVTFEQYSSDYFLPRNEASGYDMVLLDGKHAFPWPVIDWFYTADKLKKDGLMVIDDAAMKPVATLTSFMKADPGWEMVEDFSGKTMVFRKMRELAHDVAWHMQPYAAITPIEKIKNRLKRLVSSGN